MDQQRFEEAQADFNKALAIDPDNVLALINSSVVHLYSNEPQIAIDLLDHAIEITHEYPSAFDHRAQAWYMLADYEKAITDWLTYFELQPDSAVTLDWIARSYIALKQYETAMEYIDQGLALNPDLIDLSYQKGVVLLQLKDYTRSLEFLQIAIDAGVNLDLAYFNSGIAHYYRGEITKAIECFQEVIILSENEDLVNTTTQYLISLNAPVPTRETP